MLLIDKPGMRFALALVISERKPCVEDDVHVTDTSLQQVSVQHV